jgi:polar amino acid transport system substrate-binding protein
MDSQEGEAGNDMKRLIMYILTGILVCLFMGTPASAGRTLAVAVNPNWPPMEMKDKTGKLSGYEIDLIQAIGEEAGFQIQFVEVPWRKIFSGLEEGKYDVVIASVSITDARKEKYDFSTPYFTAEQLLVVPKAKAEETCREKILAAFKLTTGAEALRLYQKNSITFYTVEETENAFRDLSKGLLDGIFCDSPLAMEYTAYNSKYKDKFAIATVTMPDDYVLPKEQYGMAVKKGNAEVLGLINLGLKAVRDKGIEGQIRSRWIRSPELDLGCKQPEKEGTPSPMVE